MRMVSKQAVLLYFILLAGVSVIFARYSLPPLWMIIGMGSVFLSFHFFYRLSRRWAPLPEKVFRKRVFWTALWVRVVYVVASYFFYTMMTGIPFEIAAADSQFYHYQGLKIAEFVRIGQFDIYSLDYIAKVSSKGVIIVMGTVYALFFDSIMAFRIVNSVLGAWICVFVYDIAKRSFGWKAARISAVMAVVAPPLIYYCGLHLKEAIIVFWVVLFINVADHLLKERQFSFKALSLLIGTVIAMFWFRNSLAIALVMSFITAVVFTSGRVSVPVRRFMVGVVIITSLLIFVAVNQASDIQEEAEFYFSERISNLEKKMTAYATKGGNKFAEYGTKTIFFPLGIIGPLPTLVATVGQEDIFMRAGAMFYRNVLAFFALFAMYLMARKQLWRSHVLLLAIFFSWLFILSNSGYALSDRFHLVFVPIVVILAGYGMTMATKKVLVNFKLYILFLGCLIFVWNWFKLAGRGLV
jgi:hypothetical protein